MSSFKATLDIGGTEFNVITVDYEFSRDTDKLGKATSAVYGGRVTVTVEATSSTQVVESMLNSQATPIPDIKVTFPYSNQDGTMKELILKQAYVVYYKGALDTAGETPMTNTFTFSAQTMEIGNAVLEKNWEGQPNPA